MSLHLYHRHHTEHLRRSRRHLQAPDHHPSVGHRHHLSLSGRVARHVHTRHLHSRIAHRCLHTVSDIRILHQHHLTAGSGAGHRSGGRRCHRGGGGRTGQHRQRRDSAAGRPACHEERHPAYHRHHGGADGRIYSRIADRRHIGAASRRTSMSLMHSEIYTPHACSTPTS